MLRKALKSSEFILKIVKFALLLHECSRRLPFHQKEAILGTQIMKKHVFFTLLATVYCALTTAQPNADSIYQPKGKNQLLSFSASIPVGRFMNSHLAGLGLSYNWSHHRFGDSVNARKIVGFTAQAGIDYFLGKSVNTTGQSFRYGNLLYVQTMPGVIYNPNAKSYLTLLAGPTLSIYKNSASLYYAVNLSGAYHISQQLSLGPTVIFRKKAEVDALWAAGLKLSYVF